MKQINNDEEKEKVIQNSDATLKEKLREILNKGVYSSFKNDCGRVNHVHTILGKMLLLHPQHPVYPDVLKKLQKQYRN